jgi:hypothetical protein
MDGPADTLASRVAAAEPNLMSKRTHTSIRLRGCSWSKDIPIHEAGTHHLLQRERRAGAAANRLSACMGAACFPPTSEAAPEVVPDESSWHSSDSDEEELDGIDSFGPPPPPPAAGVTSAAPGAARAELELCVTVWPAPGRFVRTKCITVAMRFVVRNACPFPLQLAQAGCAHAQTLPSGWLGSVAWSDASAPRELQLRPLTADDERWRRSAPFPLAAAATAAHAALRVRAQRTPRAMLLALDVHEAVKAAGATLLLTVSPGDASPAFRIENACAALTFRFRQQTRREAATVAAAGGDGAARGDARRDAKERAAADFASILSGGGGGGSRPYSDASSSSMPKVAPRPGGGGFLPRPRSRDDFGRADGDKNEDADADADAAAEEDAFTTLPPGAAAPYAWDDLRGPKRVAAEVRGPDGRRALPGLLYYTLEKIGPRPEVPLPLRAAGRGPPGARTLYVEVYVDGATRVLRLSDQKTRATLEAEADVLFLVQTMRTMQAELDACSAALGAAAAAALAPEQVAALRANWRGAGAALQRWQRGGDESGDVATAAAGAAAPSVMQVLRAIEEEEQEGRASPPQRGASTPLAARTSRALLGGTLCVTVVAGRGFSSRAAASSPLYVRAAADGAAAATVTSRGAPDPVWQQTLRLDAVLAASELRVEAFAIRPGHHLPHGGGGGGGATSHTPLGAVRIPLESVTAVASEASSSSSTLPPSSSAAAAAPSELPPARWYALARRSASDDSASSEHGGGELLLALQWAVSASEVAALQIARLRRAIDARRELLALVAPRPLRLDAPALPQGLSARLYGSGWGASAAGGVISERALLERHVGTLRVGVLCARRVPLPRGRSRTRDCYVAVRLSYPPQQEAQAHADADADADAERDGAAPRGARRDTHVLRDCLAPAWDAHFAFPGARLSGEVSLTLYDHNLVGRSFLGAVRVPAAAFGDGAPRYAWLRLAPRALAPPPPPGAPPPPELYVRLQFTATALAPVGAAAATSAAELGSGGDEGPSSPAAAALPRKLDVSVAIALRGIEASLSHRMRELICVTLRGLDATASRSEHGEAASLLIRDAQVDNQMVDARSEVVVARRRAPVQLRSADAAPGASSASAASSSSASPDAAALWLSVSRARGAAAAQPGGRVLSLEAVSCIPGPFDVNVDETLLDALVECVRELPFADLWQGEEWRRQRAADVARCRGAGGEEEGAPCCAAVAAAAAAAEEQEEEEEAVVEFGGLPAALPPALPRWPAGGPRAPRAGGADVRALLAAPLLADAAAAAAASAGGSGSGSDTPSASASASASASSSAAATSSSRGRPTLYIKRLILGDLRANCTLTTAAGRTLAATQLQARTHAPSFVASSHHRSFCIHCFAFWLMLLPARCRAGAAPHHGRGRVQLHGCVQCAVGAAGRGLVARTCVSRRSRRVIAAPRGAAAAARADAAAGLRGAAGRAGGRRRGAAARRARLRGGARRRRVAARGCGGARPRRSRPGRLRRAAGAGRHGARRGAGRLRLRAAHA